VQDRIIGLIAVDPLIYSHEPAQRLRAGQDAGKRARRHLLQVDGWPPESPGAVNAWLLLVTTNPPAWRDPLVLWRDLPPTLAEPHEGFFYPDPLGFWAEVRRWTSVLFGMVEPDWGLAESLSLTTLLHTAGDAGRLSWAQALMQPRLVLFLDEPSWRSADMSVREHPHHIPDPHRAGQVYEGFWASNGDGTVVGKAPQHPATHRLYRAADMDAFLSRAPIA
jgi:hypothetical protein